MADGFQLEILNSGIDNWNKWRVENPEVRIDLSSAVFKQNANLENANLSNANLRSIFLVGANLQKTDLTNADFSRGTLEGANFKHAILIQTHLSYCNLVAADFPETVIKECDFIYSNISYANFINADLENANLRGAILTQANLTNANLTGAILDEVVLIKTKIKNAKLTNCSVFGISAWALSGIPSDQTNLIITPNLNASGIDEPKITVDNLQLAQFIYLLLHNENIRNVIDTITSKTVLILGRFTSDRMYVLEALRSELRYQNFTPILFDFDKPVSKDITGTIETLARLARFIIVDITNPSSVPHELATIIPFLRTTPVQPIKLEGSSEYSMFGDLLSYNWVLKPFIYKDDKSLMSALSDIIAPANKMAEKIRNG
jgi:hypothetical protein